jgi:hypothetical protein
MNLLIFIVREIILLDVTLVIHSWSSTRVSVLLHVQHLSISTLLATLLDRASSAPEYLLDCFLSVSHHSEVLVTQTVGWDEEDNGFLSDPVVIQSQV